MATVPRPGVTSAEPAYAFVMARGISWYFHFFKIALVGEFANTFSHVKRKHRGTIIYTP
jgi:hypothetical protein